MRENFESGMDLLVVLEGGETHKVEDDPGGLTSGFGITQRTYDNFRRGKGLEVQSVEDIMPDETMDIFKEGYWNICNCDDLPNVMDLVVFACAVNRGPFKTIKILQRALEVKPDGIIGPITLMEAKCCDTELVVEKILDYQYEFYVKERAKDKFTKGLANRVIKTAKFLDFAYAPPEIME